MFTCVYIIYGTYSTVAAVAQERLICLNMFEPCFHRMRPAYRKLWRVGNLDLMHSFGQAYVPAGEEDIQKARGRVSCMCLAEFLT